MPSEGAVQTPCPAGVTPEVLSTWLARGLEPDEAERMAAHVPSCADCQAQLAAYDEIGSLLRAQTIPATGGGVWEQVEQHLALGSFGWRAVPVLVSARTALRSAWHKRPATNWPRICVPSAVNRARASRPTRALGAVVLIAVLLLIIVGFATMLGQHTPSAPLALGWRQVTLPAGADTNLENQGTFIAPSNGNIAYACILPSGGGDQVQIQVTHDAGTHWLAVGKLPLHHQNIDGCSVTVDELDPTIAAAIVTWSGVPQAPILADGQFATHDGGVTWQHVPKLAPTMPGIGQIATWHGITYATAGNIALFSSRDQMQTWQPIGSPTPVSGAKTLELLAHPDTGELLANVHDYSRDQSSLWLSDDSGRNWSQMTAPREYWFRVQQPIPGQPWRVCGFGLTVGGNPLLDQLACSWDGGKTWTSEPLPPGHTDVFPFAVTSSGDLLAEGGPAGHSVLYRLVQAKGEWQSIAPPPTPAPLVGGASFLATYAPDDRGGTLWCRSFATGTPGVAGGDTLSGMYVAEYPGG